MPDIRGLISDPDFQGLSPEDKRDVLSRAKADPKFIDELLGTATAEAAPAAAPAAPGEHPMASFGRGSARGLGTGLLSLIDPRTYIDTAKMAVKAASQPTAVPGMVIDAAKGVGGLAKAAVGLEGPEAMGEAIGGLLPAAIPVGGLLGRIGRYGRESKAANVIKAVSETNPAKKQVLEKLVNSGELELPVSSSAKSLRAKMAEKVAEAGPELEAAKGDLQGLPEVSVKQAVKDLVDQRPVVEGAKTTTTVQPKTPAGLTSTKPAPVTVTTTAEGSGNPALLSAVDAQIDELLKVAGANKAMKPDAIQAFKEQAQAAALSAYKVAHGTGQATAVGAEASDMVAKALRETLETSPGIPASVRNRLTDANKEMSKLLAVTKPMEARRLADIDKPFISRSISGLLGRGLTGGGSSALGAAAGVEAGSQFQNVLFNTLSAAGKAKIAPLLEAGDFQAAVQAAFAEHIAETAARRRGAATP